MPTRIQISHFTKQNNALLVNFGWKSFAANVFRGLSISLHNITLFSFNNKIWFNNWKKVVKHSTCCLPVINWSRKLLLTCPSISRILRSSKGIFEPNNEFFITTRYFEHRMPLESTSIFSLFNISQKEATLSIDNTCKVCDLCNSVICVKFNNFGHFDPFICYSIILNEEKVHAERLNGRDSAFTRVCESLNSIRKILRSIRRGWSATLVVTKVTECLNESALLLGISLRESEDQLTRDMLASTAAFINCTAGVNGDNPTELTRPDVDNVVKALLGNDAYTILDNLEGQDKFGTSPIRDAYFAMCHTDLTKDMDSVAGFVNKNQYPSPMNALRSEWGAIGNIRFLVSSVGSVTTAASNLGANVYNIFVAGMQSYACVEQDGYSASFIYRSPLYDGPLALNASVGYKFAEVPRLLNDSWLFNLRATLAQ